MNSNLKTYCPPNKQAWRKWLEENHINEQGVWLIFYKKSSATPNLSWSEAVDEALCFGWIDSVKKSIDSEKYKQYFGKRKDKSNWSRVNKEKIKLLTEKGLIRKMGLRSVAIAKENGSWNILDSVENLEIPSELNKEFKKNPEAETYFLSLSKSVRKTILYWVVSAKRAETKQKRIEEIVQSALNQEKPKPFR